MGNMGFNGTYPLVNCYITNWKITISSGKTHYFDWAIFQLANCKKLPEGKSSNKAYPSYKWVIIVILQVTLW